MPDTEIDTKYCTLCNEEFPNTREYFGFQREKLEARCQQCKRTLLKAWRKKNPLLYGAQKKRHKTRNPRMYKNSMLKHYYGITIEVYEEMLRQQNGVCAICKNPERVRKAGTQESKALSVDHDHRTGRIRGLLCTNCNTALGLLFENTTMCFAVVEYIRFHMQRA